MIDFLSHSAILHPKCLGSESHDVFLCINIYIWVLASRKLTYLTSLKGIWGAIILKQKCWCWYLYGIWDRFVLEDIQSSYVPVM